MNKPLGEIFAERESESEIIGKLEGNDYIRNYETRVSAMDGRKIPVSINGSVIKDKGSVLGYVLIMRDMTETKELINKLEVKKKDLDKKMGEMTETKTAVLNMMEDMDVTNKELVETQEKLKKSLKELEKMNVKKDQFISIAAHELKTPLTSIHGFSQLLQNHKIANDLKKRDNYLKIMDHETKRLARLVSDILDLSRIDLGTVKISLEKVDLNKVMDNVQKEMDMQIKEKGLKSKYEVEKGMPKIVTDREKLTEVLINLINNSVKYTPKGSITVKAYIEGGNIHFCVKDTGIGIEKDEHKRIFERFYQVDSSYTRKTKGTGLGLALSSEYLELLGGKIWVESELGKGSEFHFTLPIKGAPKKQVTEDKKRAEEGIKKAEEVRKKVSEFGIASVRSKMPV